MTRMVLRDSILESITPSVKCTFIYHITQVMQIPSPADKDHESHNGQGNAHSTA